MANYNLVGVRKIEGKETEEIIQFLYHVGVFIKTNSSNITRGRKKVHEVSFFFLSHRQISRYFPLAHFDTSQRAAKIQRKPNKT